MYIPFSSDRDHTKIIGGVCCGLVRPFVTFGGSGGIMTTARPKFSHLGFWSGNLFLIAPFPDLCLLVPSYPCGSLAKTGDVSSRRGEEM